MGTSVLAAPDLMMLVFFSPSIVGHLVAFVRQDLYTVFEPLPGHLVVRDLTLKHGLIGGFHREISNVLQHLQFLLWRER